MSRSPKAKAKRPPRRLPLDDPRWVPLEAAHDLLTQRTANRDLAADDLTELLATRVRSMRRYFRLYRDVPRRDVEREQLPFSFWADEHVLQIWSGGFLCICKRREGVPIPAGALYGSELYVWKPDLEEGIWPSDAPSTTPSERPADALQPPPRRRGLPPDTERWWGICAEIARRCINEKTGLVAVPKSENKLAESVLGWLEENGQGQPSTSEMRAAVKHICAALRKAQK